jgi:hypothetical protein
VLAQLPAAMQKEVAEHIHESMLAVMPLFHNLPDSETPVLKQLLGAFKPLAVQPFDPVCECCDRSPSAPSFCQAKAPDLITPHAGSSTIV